MNREELMKKLDVGRVGNGTQTYNDVVLTLTKEETLELLKYIDKLDKHNKNLCRLNAETLGESVEIHNENATLKLKLEQLEKKYQELEERFKKRAELCIEFSEYTRQYEKVLDFLMDKFKLELKVNRLYFLYNNQYFELDKEEYELLKEVLESDR